MEKNHAIRFTMGGMIFEYDEEKNENNIKKHGLSLKNAAKVFWDYDRIELYDEEHSEEEDRFDLVGRIGDDILFVVYTERVKRKRNGKKVDVIRIISARMATDFERRLYYDKLD